MHFINKLIKRGTFVLLLMFSFFVFGNSFNAQAATCESGSIELNDGNKYLVVNQALNWVDSGVTAKCDGAPTQRVTVQINNGTPNVTTDSGLEVAKNLSAGIYKIKYWLTDNPEIFVIRQIRVLPNNLNNAENFWVAETDKVNTTNDDAFNRVININVGAASYLAVGNFSDTGYIVLYNARGEYLGHNILGTGENVVGLKLNDVIAVEGRNNLFYIAGEYIESVESVEITKGFVKIIEVEATGTNGLSGFDQNVYGVEGTTSVSKITVAGDYLYAVGYVVKSNEEQSVVVRMQIQDGGFVAPYPKEFSKGRLNDVITTLDGSDYKIIAVGGVDVDGYAGARAGVILRCDAVSFDCEEQKYYYLNDNKATTTKTEFSSVVSYETADLSTDKQNDVVTRYLVVGNSRIDLVRGVTQSASSGVEDSIVVLLDEILKVKDVKLFGTAGADGLKSVKLVDSDSGKFAFAGYEGNYNESTSTGVYGTIEVEGDRLNVSSKTISGTNVRINDVFVKVYAGEETQIAFVGSAAGANVGGVVLNNAGRTDALMALVDSTVYKAFSDIYVEKGAGICGSTPQCDSENLDSNYNLIYGTRGIGFSAGVFVDTTISGVSYSVYHNFENNQGVVVMIGRKIYVVASPEAPDMSTSHMGINKWYLYNRENTTKITADINGGTRIPTWEEYYYPVNDYEVKKEGVTYYKLSTSTLQFVVDSSEEETYKNYIKLAQEPQNEKVAFQSVEKAREFAVLQEYTRVAFVKENYYDSNSQSIQFAGQRINLRMQNYYFIYYIDVKLSNNACNMDNGVLDGDCTHFFGYAFSSLNDLKKAIDQIAERGDTRNSYFITEQNNVFDGRTSLPETNEFSEELRTVEYVKSKEISLDSGLVLEVKYYEPSGSSLTGYTGYVGEENVEITTINDKSLVSFNVGGDYTKEGKYIVRKCYNYGLDNQDCGNSSEFVIDRTAPIVNYSLFGGTRGQITQSYTKSNPLMLKTTMNIMGIHDIDPYAYTIHLDGKAYFIKCNADVNSATCLKQLDEAVNKRIFEFDPKNPEGLHYIEVKDRAGNIFTIYMKIGTGNPSMEVIMKDNGEDIPTSFVLDLNFYGKNDLDSLIVEYIASQKGITYPANGADIGPGIMAYITEIKKHNLMEYQNLLDAEKNGKEYNPNYIEKLWDLASCNPFKDQNKCTDLMTFSVADISGTNGDYTITAGGVMLPKVDGYGNAVRDEDGNIEFEKLPITNGLYRFTIADSFDNFAEAYGGIGIGKSDVSLYIENDPDYKEYVNVIEALDVVSNDNEFEIENVIYVVDGTQIKIKTEGTYLVGDTNLFTIGTKSYTIFDKKVLEVVTTVNGENVFVISGQMLKIEYVEETDTYDIVKVDSQEKVGIKEEFKVGNDSYSIVNGSAVVKLVEKMIFEAGDNRLIKIPVLENQTGGFAAQSPSVYKYFETLPVALHGDFNDKMYYTDQFVYVKFKADSYEVIKISKANKLNKFGNYIEGKTENLTCMFAFYGETVWNNGSPIGITQCDKKYSFEDMKSSSQVRELLAQEGIYIVGSSQKQDEANAPIYYYIAFTKDGVYDVSTNVITNFEDKNIDLNLVTIPIKLAFTIDSKTPDIGFEIVCNASEQTEYDSCRADRDSIASYTREDFVFEAGEKPLVNLGNYDMKLILNTDVFTYINALGDEETQEDRLVVVNLDGRPDGEKYNAYEYSLKNFDPINGNYLQFSDSGTYEITFKDSGDNTITYRFMIDKNRPTVGELKDINGKSFESYQQFVDVGVDIGEDSFVDTTGNILTIEFWITNEDNKGQIGVVKTLDGGCEISTGSGLINSNPKPTCSAGSNGINVSFSVGINKGKNPTSDRQTFTIRVEDYFGNEYSATTTIYFDNLSPYIDFDYSKYTPTTNYGSQYAGGNGDENWLTTAAMGSLDHFECGADVFGKGGIILCDDTPERDNRDNGVQVYAYEAQRVTYGNYRIRNDGTYELMADNEKLDANDVVYKGEKFTNFSSASELESVIGEYDIFIYKKGRTITLGEKDLVDPNKEYYYYADEDVNKTTKIFVNIKDMYTSGEYSSYTNLASCTTAKCNLYRMYVETGYFTDGAYTFYYDDETEYTDVTMTIDGNNYGSYTDYYYVNRFIEDYGKYLPALTLDSCVVVNNGDSCIPVVKGRVKLTDSAHKYYTIVNASYDNALRTIEEVTINGIKTKVLPDNNIWMIATDELGNEIKFGFGIPQEMGRPIIFKAIDIAGNIGVNHIETVIAIKDENDPGLESVYTIKYVKDESVVNPTSDHYVKVYKYYKVASVGGKTECDSSYYVYSAGSYKSVEVEGCNKYDEYTQFYVKRIVYEQYKAGITDLVETDVYYKRQIIEKINDGNYLTPDDYMVTFDEPINKVFCSYYIYDVKAGEGHIVDCSFNNTEYNYREEKRTFELVFDNPENLENYYIEYSIRVVDISGNEFSMSGLYVDRESPIITLKNSVLFDEYIPVDYVGNKSNRYNSSYLNSENYVNDASDLITDDKVNGILGQENNPITYEVTYKKFNFNKVYLNYIYEDGEFKPVVPNPLNPDDPTYNNGIKKEGVTYYVLMKESDFKLKGIMGTCKDGYCYVVDDRNYYPSLLLNDEYWEDVPGNSIDITKIGVYRIQYVATDSCGNVGNTITRTIYITDNTDPELLVNNSKATSKYGQYKTVNIKFDNEYEATWYEYSCLPGKIDCVLPDELFVSGSAKVMASTPEIITSSGDKNYSMAGKTKVVLVDSGNYQSSTISCAAFANINCEQENNAMSLKYNYTTYEFVIDKTPPIFEVEAKKDNNNKLYYEVILKEDETLYCSIESNRLTEVTEFKNDNSPCQNKFSVKEYKFEVKNENGKEIASYSAYDGNKNVLYIVNYEKIHTSTYFFFNTYYKIEGEQIIKYHPEDVFDDDNVYVVATIKYFFRNDGKYSFSVRDTAGNYAGRTLNSKYEANGQYFSTDALYEQPDKYRFSQFEIDNTAPTYNQSQNQPTGNNFWYSVPSKVIETETDRQRIKSLIDSKNTQFNILSESTLNSNYFYAFATQREAKAYLDNIYSDHIESQEFGTCNNGAGFAYSYFDGEKMVNNRCFTSVAEAENVVKGILNKFIFETFSEGNLFSDPQIQQIACDPSVSVHCENSSMYRYVYLKQTYSEAGVKTSSIVAETCENEYYDFNETKIKVNCIRINVKLVREGTTGSFVLGRDNVSNPDSAKMVYYLGNKNRTGDPVEETSSARDITLSVGYYYIFEETDKVIEYTNQSSKITHYNTSYYAIYVDDATYLNVYYQDDKVNEESLYISDSSGLGGMNTNHNRFNLILKMEKDGEGKITEASKNKYEIYEEKDSNGAVIKVYSYLRVSVNGVYYNLTDGRYLQGDVDDYWFLIPLVDMNIGYADPTEVGWVFNVTMTDRVGNVTAVRISHSQVEPNISVAYSGTEENQSVTLEIHDNKYTLLDTSSIKISYSSDRSSWSEIRAKEILDSLLCRGNKIYGCIELGTINQINSKKVVITNQEDLFGFFKVYAEDDHGNSNEIEFMYNPTNMYSNYASSMKFITSEMGIGEPRMITKGDLLLEWDNIINYVILYKATEEDPSNFVPVCNSKDATNLLNEYICVQDGNDNNYIEHVMAGNGEYEKSVIHYEDEGIYKAEIINRASEVINKAFTKLKENAEKPEDYQNIRTYTSTSNTCMWEVNESYCLEAFDVVTEEIVKERQNNRIEVYNLLEIDKTEPELIIEDFVVNLPEGTSTFIDGSVYTNANVIIKWNERGVSLVYSCEYVNPRNENDICSGNTITFNSPNQAQGIKVLGDDINRSVRYTFYFVDYIGNQTDSLSFTINIVLPEISAHQVDKNGDEISNGTLKEGDKTKNDVKLTCYLSGQEFDCGLYYIELKKDGKAINYSNPVVPNDKTYGTYTYVAYIKSSEGGIYNANLKTEISFVIDKEPPEITITPTDTGNVYGFHKGEVNISVGQKNTGVIYNGCEVISDDIDKVYKCNETPYKTFTTSTGISETGVYMIVAIDDVGNITEGNDPKYGVKYITIDNKKPTISVISKTDYLETVLPEAGYTNSKSVVVTGMDNNDGVKLSYCLMTIIGQDCTWQDAGSDEITFTEEGLYKVKSTDAVGNVSIERSFTIYRQAPKFSVFEDKESEPVELSAINTIFTKSVYVTWNDPENVLQAPIVKVTMNGKPYADRTLVSGTGEYVFAFVDLAGNTTTYKLSINKNENICLDGVCIKPNAQYDAKAEEILSFERNKKYEFKEGDVFIFASKSNTYALTEECSSGIFNYKSLYDKQMFVVLGEEQANAINNLPPRGKYKLIRLTEEEIETIKALDGSVYIFVVDKEVAVEKLGFYIPEEKTFIEDPIGFAIILVAGMGLLYAGLKLTVFKKRVRVLK